MRYFFVDQLVEMELGKSAVAKKNITATEDCFADHFPGFPVYPGALLVETMAQTGGLLIDKTIVEREGRRVLPLLSIVQKAKFKEPVLPGDSLLIRVDVENITEEAATVEAKITCDDRIKATAKLFYMLVDAKRDLGLDGLPEVDMVQSTLERMNRVRDRLNGGTSE